MGRATPPDGLERRRHRKDEDVIRVFGFIKKVIVACLIICLLNSVVLAAYGILELKRGSTIEQNRQAARDAATAARGARSDLAAAVAQVGRPNPQLQAAFNAIFRLDCKLNGTPESCAAVRP